MTYLGGSTVFFLQGSVIGSWLERGASRPRGRAQVSQLPDGPSEQTLRAIALMDREVADKITLRRRERPARRTTTAKQSQAHVTQPQDRGWTVEVVKRGNGGDQKPQARS